MNVDFFPDKSRIKTDIKINWNLDIVGFDFIQKGYGDHNYVIHDNNNHRYFLKLAINVKGTETGLKVCQFLHSQNIHDVSKVIPTNSGKVGIRFNNMFLCILEYIDGKEIGEDTSITYQRDGLDLLHQIHQLNTTHLDFEIEKFEFNDDITGLLTTRIAEINNKTFTKTYELDFVDLLKINAAHIQQDIDMITLLRTKCNMADKPMLICHRDCHHYNFMLDKNKTLFLIDWDSVKLGPPETDLIFFSIQDIADNYLSRFKTKFNTDVYIYSLLERQLDDLQDFIRLILLSDAPDAEKQARYKNIVDFGFEFDFKKILNKTTSEIDKIGLS